MTGSHSVNAKSLLVLVRANGVRVSTRYWLCKINRIHHGCPVEIGKSQPEGPPIPVGNEARRVSHWNGGPEGWDFPVSTEHP